MTPKSIRQTEEKGVYTLLVKVKLDEWIKVGRLGRLRFSGLYAYTGSGVGKGSTSLNGRVSRHLCDEKKTRWHIDYLLRCPSAEVKSLVTSRTEIKSKECEVAYNILSSNGYVTPIDKFGSSDCSCRSHLIHLEGSSRQALQTILKAYKRSGLNPRAVSRRRSS
nr:GIY-YIG nuclease family protein [Candidatus Njordarchaeota archaeon]